MQAACKVASWEASVQKGTFNDASSGVCVVSSNADGAEVAVERGRERVAFSSAVEKALLRVTTFGATSNKAVFNSSTSFGFIATETFAFPFLKNFLTFAKHFLIVLHNVVPICCWVVQVQQQS